MQVNNSAATKKNCFFRKHILWMSMQEKYVINCIKPSLYLLIFAKIRPKIEISPCSTKKNPQKYLISEILSTFARYYTYKK